MTNLQLISDALRLIGVISESETPSAEQGSLSLRALNQMLEQWEAVDGVNVGYFAQTSTTASLPIPAYAETAVTYALAVKLAPLFGATISSEVAIVGGDAYQGLLRLLMNAKLKGADMTHLPYGAGNLPIFDITNG